MILWVIKRIFLRRIVIPEFPLIHVEVRIKLCGQNIDCKKMIECIIYRHTDRHTCPNQLYL